MTKKFELTSESKEFDGVTLFRIRALKSFSDVKKGDLGGWVETENNLAQEGNAWVYDEARVSGWAIVCSWACVKDRSHVFGSAHVCGWVNLSGDAQVSDGLLISAPSDSSNYDTLLEDIERKFVQEVDRIFAELSRDLDRAAQPLRNAITEAKND